MGLFNPGGPDSGYTCRENADGSETREYWGLSQPAKRKPPSWLVWIKLAWIALWNIALLLVVFGLLALAPFFVVWGACHLVEKVPVYSVENYLVALLLLALFSRIEIK